VLVWRAAELGDPRAMCRRGAEMWRRAQDAGWDAAGIDHEDYEAREQVDPTPKPKP